MKSLILPTAARFLMPLLVLFSLFLLLRGHNDPGGGFAGGLVASAALALYSIAADPAAARRAIRVDPRSLIGSGLLLATASALLPMFMGLPILTGLWTYIPLFGDTRVELGSPLFFDIGVYLVVFGVTSTFILTLAEE